MKIHIPYLKPMKSKLITADTPILMWSKERDDWVDPVWDDKLGKYRPERWDDKYGHITVEVD